MEPITGRVVDEHDAPVAGATVLAYSEAELRALQAVGLAVTAIRSLAAALVLAGVLAAMGTGSTLSVL